MGTDTSPLLPGITGLVLTHNGERLIDACLSSLGFCDAILVVDSGSGDNTLEIARRHGARIVHHDWRGFDVQFTFAQTLVQTRWFFILDQDEICPPALGAAILDAVRAAEMRADEIRTEVQAAERQAASGQAATVRNAEGRNAEGRNAEGRNAEGRDAEMRADAPHSPGFPAPAQGFAPGSGHGSGYDAKQDAGHDAKRNSGSASFQDSAQDSGSASLQNAAQGSAFLPERALAQDSASCPGSGDSGSSAAPVAFSVGRKSWYFDRFLLHSGWYPDHILRVFRTGYVEFYQDAHIHYRPLGNRLHVGAPGAELVHYPYSGFAHHFLKLNTYAQQGADHLRAKGKKGGIAAGVLHALWRFLRIYILKRGFLDGKAGFLVACHGSFYAFLKYVRVMDASWGAPFDEK